MPVLFAAQCERRLAASCQGRYRLLWIPSLPAEWLIRFAIFNPLIATHNGTKGADSMLHCGLTVTINNEAN